MVKNRVIWNFFLKYLFFNKFFVILVSVLFSANIGIHLILRLFIGASPVLFNNWVFIIIQSDIFLILFLVIILVFFIFNSPKNNDISKFLLLTPYSHKKLFIQKSLFALVFLFVFSIANASVLAIIDAIFNDYQFMYLSLILALLNCLIALLFLPLLILLAVFFQKVPLIIMSMILLLSVSGSFFVSRLIATPRTSDSLNYRFNVNKNNYVRLNVLNDVNQPVSQWTLGITTYESSTSQNLSPNFIDALNPTNSQLSALMIGDVFNQFVINFLPKPTYDYQELVELSAQNYIFNANLIATTKYKTGEPSELANFKDAHLAYVGFQDDDPFSMTYEEILANLRIEIEKLNLNTDLGIDHVNSILSATKGEMSWNSIVDSFTETQKNILESFAGKEAKWMFYILKYNSWIANKLVKIYDDIEELYGPEIRTFIEFLWLEDSFAYNVLKTENILPLEFQTANFPDIGDVQENSPATNLDLNFFKNTLVHFDKDELGEKPKILTTNNGYQFLTLDNIKEDDKINEELINSLSSEATWKRYIDANNEVINLRLIYDDLFALTQQQDREIVPEYNFEFNNSDPGFIDQVLEIKNKKWIDNPYVPLAILLAISSLIFGLSYYLNSKWEVKHV